VNLLDCPTGILVHLELSETKKTMTTMSLCGKKNESQYFKNKQPEKCPLETLIYETA